MVTSGELPAWLRTQYPFQPGSLKTAGGARMSFVDEGPRSESAVLMLHGNPTWSFYYRNLIRELSRTRRCVAPDHIGMGLSEKPEDYNYTLATRIADIERLVVELGLKQIDLVVHDWGGAIGFGFAARHPQLIRRLVVLNTAAFTMNRIPARIALCKAAGIGPWIVRGLNGFAGPATFMAMNRRRLSTEEKNGYLYPYRSWADRVAVSAFVQDIPMNASHRTWETLKSAEAGLRQFRDRAALIVWGGRDFCFNDAFLARWQEELPSARVQRIADGGHYILEDVREEVVPEIGRFLTV